MRDITIAVMGSLTVVLVLIGVNSLTMNPPHALIYTPTGYSNEYALVTGVSKDVCEQKLVDFETLPGDLVCVREPG